MGFSTDPNDRRRVDGDTQLKRDAEVARLREQHVPFRQIARRLDMSLGSVQKALARWRKRQAYLEALDAELEDELETPFSRLTFEEQNRVALAEYLADLERDPNDELARYRLRHVPTDTPGHPLAGT